MFGLALAPAWQAALACLGPNYWHGTCWSCHPSCQGLVTLFKSLFVLLGTDLVWCLVPVLLHELTSVVDIGELIRFPVQPPNSQSPCLRFGMNRSATPLPLG